MTDASRRARATNRDFFIFGHTLKRGRFLAPRLFLASADFSSSMQIQKSHYRFSFNSIGGTQEKKHPLKGMMRFSHPCER